MRKKPRKIKKALLILSIMISVMFLSAFGVFTFIYHKYELNVVDTHVEDLSLRPEKRETRLMGTYRHKFGEFTDGAFGFIYRINPNHTDDFGNESIFMLKMSHRLGI